VRDVAIPLTGLTPKHLYVSPTPGSVFPAPYIVICSVLSQSCPAPYIVICSVLSQSCPAPYICHLLCWVRVVPLHISSSVLCWVRVVRLHISSSVLCWVRVGCSFCWYWIVDHHFKLSLLNIVTVLIFCCLMIVAPFMFMFCKSLFVLLSFFVWPLCCLFFLDIRILISSNSSYDKNKIM
jgi:hypothetical protein